MSAESTRVVLIDNRTTCKDHDAVFLRQSNWELLPMEEIATYCVTPTHMTPLVAEWIVLEVQMVFAFEVDQTVRIICPMLARREMILGPIRLIITGQNPLIRRQGEEEVQRKKQRGEFQSLLLEQHHAPMLVRRPRLLGWCRSL